MDFSGFNFLSVVVAAIAGFAVGAVWYTLLGNAWVAAQGKTRADFTPSPMPYIIAAVAHLVMAFILAGIIIHVGDPTVRRALISAILIWIGFIATSMSVNHAFQGTFGRLTLIDSGHWLMVLIVQAVIFGLMGV